MISARIAANIRNGDKVFDYCGRELEIVKYTFIHYTNSSPSYIDFHCRDINTNQRFVYSNEELYQNFDDLSDEEKLFLKWLKNDGDCYCKSTEEIQLSKIAFMAGFNSGYSYKKQITAQEYLQK